MKSKQLRRLSYQFARFTTLSARDIARRLERAGLIRLTDDGTRYVETEAMHAIPRAQFDETIASILKG